MDIILSCSPIINTADFCLNCFLLLPEGENHFSDCYFHCWWKEENCLSEFSAVIILACYYSELAALFRIIHSSTQSYHLFLFWIMSCCWNKPSGRRPVYVGLVWPLWCVEPCVNSFCLCARAGADVQRGCEQDSPLHAAVRSGGANIVDLLLDFGADGCCRNAEGKTPLHLSSPDSAVRIALQKRGLLWTLMPMCWCSSNSRRFNSTAHCLCPCLHRSLLPDADLSVLYSPESGMDSPPQSLQPPPSSQHQGLSSLSIRCVEKKPSCIGTKGLFYQFVH